MYLKNDWFLHQRLAQTIDDRLACVKMSPQRVILMGADGNSLYPLLSKRYPSAHFDEIDSQRERLAYAKQCRKKPYFWYFQDKKITQINQDIDCQVVNKADLVLSNLFLTAWLPEQIPHILSVWHDALHEHGMLFLCCLGADSLQEIRPWMDEFGISRTRLQDIHDWGDMLWATGFADPVVDTEKMILNYSSSAAFWRDMNILDLLPAREDPLYHLFFMAIEKQFLSGSLKGITLEIIQAHAIKPEKLGKQDMPIHFFPSPKRKNGK